MKIDLDLVEFAALAHDIGHPPFGHNGEQILDELMLSYGGFEGNAQTLRILSKLEKKATYNFPAISNIPVCFDAKERKDLRCGLNLSYRTLASIIKYDNIIPRTKGERVKNSSDGEPVKGIYLDEEELLDRIKTHVGYNGKNFKTIECHIMDIADDIAYSTYDIEDSMKAGFLTPLKILSMPDSFKERVAKRVKGKMDVVYSDLSESERNFGLSSVNSILTEIFGGILSPSKETMNRVNSGVSFEEAAFIFSANTHQYSSELCENGYYRTEFTSELVGEYVRNVEFKENLEYPNQSRVRLKLDTFKKVETLKRYAFELLIDSPRLKMAERRGREIIKKIFETLNDKPELLPDDWSNLYFGIDDDTWRARVVCDYVSGMTDRYCVEIYSRLTGENPMTIWKPH